MSRVKKFFLYVGILSVILTLAVLCKWYAWTMGKIVAQQMFYDYVMIVRQMPISKGIIYMFLGHEMGSRYYCELNYKRMSLFTSFTFSTDSFLYDQVRIDRFDSKEIEIRFDNDVLNCNYELFRHARWEFRYGGG